MSFTKLIGLTGPSTFTPDCIRMIEDGLKCNFILLYQNRMEHIQQWLDNCDGLIVSGGVDMHPTLYDESVKSNMGLTKFDYARDVKELLIIDYCFKQKKPIMGICRGHQLMAVYKGLGRDFIMDLDGKYIHQPTKYSLNLQKNEPAHKVELIAPDIFNVPAPEERKVFRDTIPGNEAGECPKAWVNSWHHQGVKYIKKHKEQYAKLNLRILAIAPTGMEDNSQVIEMMTGTGQESFWVTTQWHPEADWEENSASRNAMKMYEAMLANYKKE